MPTSRIIKLTPPQISSDHIKEKIVCIRGHRERLFCTSSEIVNHKLICHNYGHGGAGWTFLFGCVNESLRKFEQVLLHEAMFRNKPIKIIGAGCYGLLTAIMLARKGYTVSIIAKDINSIASYRAAGFFFPRPRKVSTPEETAIFLSLGAESYSTYTQIIKGEHPFIKTGPQLLPAYYGLDIDPGFGPYQAKGLISIPEPVTIDFSTGMSYDALEYKALFINSVQMMHELHRNIQELGISIKQAEVSSFSDIAESVIFNCTGLGAKSLTHDIRLIPVQGHLITLKDQPAAEQLQYMLNFKVTMMSSRNTPRDELIYYAPKDSGILGITFLRGQDSLNTNHHEFDRLLERCHTFFGL